MAGTAITDLCWMHAEISLPEEEGIQDERLTSTPGPSTAGG